MPRHTPPALRLVALEDRSTPAAVGGPDPTFAGTGTATAAFDFGGANADAGAAVAVDSFGRVVVVGSAQMTGTDVDFAVARFNPDGTPDASFGTDGQVAIGFDLGGGNDDRATAVAIDAFGRIVVAGTVESDSFIGDFDFGVIRLTDDGALDPAFDGDGRATVAFDLGGTKFDQAAGVAIDAAGRIVVAGTVQVGQLDTDFGVARLTDDGSLDPTFDGDGRQEVAFDRGGDGVDLATAVAVLSDGAVVVAGTAQMDAAGDFDFAAARLTEQGVLDSSFGSGGLVTVAFDKGGTNADVATGLAVDSSDRVVLAGTVEEAAAGDIDFGVARLNDDGSLDPTFNETGTVSAAFDLGGANADQVAGVGIDPFGRIVVAGTVEQPDAGDTDFGVLRLNPDGTLDPAFDADGRATMALDLGASAGLTADTAAGVAVVPNGRIVVAGTSETAVSGDTDFGVARMIGGTELAGAVLAAGPPNGTVRRFDPTGSGFAAGGAVPVGTGTARPVAADVDGDGFADTVVGAGPGGGSEVRIDFADGSSPVLFDAFEPGFAGGVFVAAADIDGNGRAEVIVSPDVGGGGRVSIFGVNPDGTVSLLDNFFGIADPTFRGGARVAAGDIDGDGFAEVVVGAGFLGGPRVAVFDGVNLLANNPDPGRLIGDFFAFPGEDATRLRNGVFVTVGDVTGDGLAEMIFGGGPGGGPRVFVLDAADVLTGGVAAAQADPVANFFVAGNDSARGGVRLAVKDIDGDELADLVTASGDDQPSRVRVYPGTGFPRTNGVEPPLLQEFDPFGAVLADGVFVG